MGYVYLGYLVLLRQQGVEYGARLLVVRLAGGGGLAVHLGGTRRVLQEGLGGAPGQRARLQESLLLLAVLHNQRRHLPTTGGDRSIWAIFIHHHGEQRNADRSMADLPQGGLTIW